MPNGPDCEGCNSAPVYAGLLPVPFVRQPLRLVLSDALAADKQRVHVGSGYPYFQEHTTLH